MLYCVIAFDEKWQNDPTLVIGGTKNIMTRYYTNGLSTKKNI